ncbi:MAG: tRNA (N6-isopentenyl adenosine(37)-C2)-methylthiotransferase MiaB, partial [Candidatus Omnitrophota bacterium]
CQMNERDSEWVEGALLEKGFSIASSQDEADIILFNTCSVRKHAEHRAISNMGALKKLKEKRPDLILGIIGCTAENYGERLFESLPHLDLVCGTGKLYDIPRAIEDIIRNREKQALTGSLDKYMPEMIPEHRNRKDLAYVMISRGCDNYCTYCIVPYVRGPERSRDPRYILEEVEGLIKRGHKRIMLLGQNVNGYGKDLKNGASFIKLLQEIDKIEGEKAISFMTSHPKGASTALFAAMRDLKSISKELHLPLQSGSDRILKAMKRGYDSGYYMKLVNSFRNILPESPITTDIIVGFPGETEKDFEATKKMLLEVEFGASYIFKYSPRPPAFSSKLKDDVPKDVKERRHRELLDIQIEISRKRRPKRALS